MAKKTPSHKKALYGIMVICFGCIISATSLRAFPADGHRPGTTQVRSVQTRTLANTTWVWQKTTNMDSTVVTPADPSKFVIKFDGKNFHSSTDCNGVSGSYLADAKLLSFGENMMSTLMFCEKSLESDYTKQLRQVAAYKISGNTLTLVLTKELGEMTFVAR